MKYIIYLINLIIILSLYKVNADTALGACGPVPILPNFDATKYIGKWYEIERLPSIFENGLKCITAQYGLYNSSYITIQNQGIKIDDGSKSIIDGYATVTPNEPNKLSVYFPMMIGNTLSFSPKTPYNVYQTDYSSYALVYSCVPILGSTIKYETGWVLSRTPTLPQNKVEELKQVLKAIGVDIKFFLKVDQSNC